MSTYGFLFPKNNGCVECEAEKRHSRTETSRKEKKTQNKTKATNQIGAGFRFRYMLSNWDAKFDSPRYFPCVTGGQRD